MQEPRPVIIHVTAHRPFRHSDLPVQLSQGMNQASGDPLGDRVVRAQDPAAALQGFLPQRPGRLGLTHRDVDQGQGSGRPEGDQVIRADQLAAALQDVLAQGAGRLRLAQLIQGEGQRARGGQGVGSTSAGLVQARATLSAAEVACTPLTGPGGVTSAAAGVVTVTVAALEVLPAASRANNA